jgi:hypothetical protein
MLLIKLLLAHFIGDFVLQSNKWVAHKEKYLFKSKYLYLHVLLHALLLLLVLGFEKKYWLAIGVISMAHLVIDGIKLMQPIKNNRILFFLDQLAHIAILFWVANDWRIPFEVQAYVTDRNLLLLLATVLLTSVTSIVLKVVFSFWGKDLEEISKEDSSLKDAGRYIGMLERLFVFTFVLLNKWEAIGFLLAAKSVFRFGDLTKASDRKLTEYILIGTLLSFGIAIMLGIVFSNLIK